MAIIIIVRYYSNSQAAKLIKSGDIGGEDRKKIFNAIGFNFLNRLFAMSECSLALTNNDQTLLILPQKILRTCAVTILTMRLLLR